jgi:hypothetical protein
LKTDILGLGDVQWFKDRGGNNGTAFWACNANVEDGSPVVGDVSGGSTITYKAVSNVGTETTTAYVFSATDKLLARISAGAGAGEEASFTDAGQAMVAASTALAQHDLLHSVGANIASAATTDLATATGWAVNVTGSVTITAFGTVQAGTPRLLLFAGAPLLTHNATSLILFGANIQAVAGDRALMISLGSGNWICADYVRAAGSFAAMSSASVAITGGSITGITDLAIADGGTAASTAVAAHDNLSTTGADIASATTTDIGAASGDYLHVTGTTTITGLGTKTAGVERWVRFTGILTLTHHATQLILPSGANITTAAGDVALFRSLGSGNWRCLLYRRESGVGGVIPQPVSAGGTGAATAALARVALSSGATALVDGASIATNCALDTRFTVTLGGNRTLANPTNIVANTFYTWLIKQDPAVARTLALDTFFIAAEGETFAVHTGLGSTTLLSAYAETTTRLIWGAKKYA